MEQVSLLVAQVTVWITAIGGFIAGFVLAREIYKRKGE